MKNYKWLLFDADGTLFDYEKAEETALINTFSAAGFIYNIDYLAEYKDINSRLWLEFEKGKISPDNLKTERFKILLDNIKLDYNHSSFSELYLGYLSQCSYLIDGTEKILKLFHKKYKLAIITNGLKEVQRKRFSTSQIFSCFDDIIISEEIGIAKPDAKFFEITFARIGNPDKREVLLIGDSLSSDIKGGINFGIDTCWFNPNKISANGVKSTYEISKIDDLIFLANLS